MVHTTGLTNPARAQLEFLETMLSDSSGTESRFFKPLPKTEKKMYSLKDWAAEQVEASLRH